MGSLNSPRDFGLYVHNFTGQMYQDVKLAHGEETTLLYRFMPDASLYALDFTVALTAFYTIGAIEAADVLQPDRVDRHGRRGVRPAGAEHLPHAPGRPGRAPVPGVPRGGQGGAHQGGPRGRPEEGGAGHRPGRLRGVAQGHEPAGQEV